jgi:phosphatidate cytidylyltransferase
VRKRSGFSNKFDDNGTSTLIPRAAVWIVFALLIFAADAFGTAALAVLMALLAVQIVRELLRSFDFAGIATDAKPVIASCLLLIIGAGLGGEIRFGLVLVAALLGTALYFLAREAVSPSFIVRLVAAEGAVIYVGGSLSTLVLLRSGPNGFAVVIWIILVISLADATAMLGGLLFGRTQITPRLSKGKTLEGVLTGVAAGLLGAAAVRFALPDSSAARYYISTVALVVAGLGGDLFASAIKRAAKIKDFGGALPGHGGLLDRLDSLIFGAPVAYALMFAS